MKKIPKIDSKPFELFLDLDGVFADLEEKFFQIAGRRVHEVEKKVFWKIIMADKGFFGSLDFMPGAEHLWEYTKQYDPVFLTGAPPGDRFKDQKREWVAKKFGDIWTVIVLPKKDKQLHSGPNKVLLDDTHQNIEQWSQKGGIGVHHKGDVWESIELLEEIRQSYKV